MRSQWQGYLHRHRYYTRCSNSPWTFHHLLKVKGEQLVIFLIGKTVQQNQIFEHKNYSLIIPKWFFSFQHTSFQSLFIRVSGCLSEPINQFVYSFLVWYTIMLIRLHSLHNFNLLWCYHLISHVPFVACLKSYPAFKKNFSI